MIKGKIYHDFKVEGTIHSQEKANTVNSRNRTQWVTKVEISISFLAKIWKNKKENIWESLEILIYSCCYISATNINFEHQQVNIRPR